MQERMNHAAYGTPGWPEVKGWLTDVLEMLAIWRTDHFVHYDIKPANLMLRCITHSGSGPGPGPTSPTSPTPPGTPCAPSGSRATHLADHSKAPPAHRRPTREQVHSAHLVAIDPGYSLFTNHAEFYAPSAMLVTRGTPQYMAQSMVQTVYNGTHFDVSSSNIL